MRAEKQRVLVVEDHELWRRRVCSELERVSRYAVAGEASDGEAALLEAQRLAPDLILLDIGLEKMNGIEAARAIREANPSARILFLTAQRSPDIAEAALATGAGGYLLKSEAAGRLELAVETVLNGGTFVSPGVAPQMAPTRAPSSPTDAWHTAIFRGDEDSLVDDYAAYAQAALHEESAVVAVCETANLGKIRERLASKGVAIDRAIEARRYVEVDSDPEFSRLMRDSCDDEHSLRAAAADVLTRAARASGQERRVALFGAIAPRLWRAGKPAAALRVELAWDAAAKAIGAHMLCGYAINDDRLAEDRYGVFRDVCARHDAVHVHQ